MEPDNANPEVSVMPETPEVTEDSKVKESEVKETETEVTVEPAAEEVEAQPEAVEEPKAEKPKKPKKAKKSQPKKAKSDKSDKAKSDKKSDKKADKSDAPAKTAGKRGRRKVAKAQYPHPFDFRRPVKSAADSIAFFKSVVEDGKKLSPNAALLTGRQYGDLVNAHDAAIDEGKTPPSLPARYDPLRRQVAAMFDAFCIKIGKGKRPRGLPENIAKMLEAGDTVVPPMRLCHAQDARDLIVDRESNVLTVGKYDYVVGTTETPAVHLTQPHKTGSYGAVTENGRLLSFEGMNEVASLVGRFNNDFVVINLDDKTDPGCEVPFAPNQIIDEWGYFIRNGKRMTVAQIRSAVEKGETSDMKFESEYNVKNPLVGKSVSRKQLGSACKRAMSLAATKDENDLTDWDRFIGRKPRSEDNKEPTDAMDRLWYNLCVICRCSAEEETPYGFRALQLGIVPSIHYGDSTDDELVRWIIGSRTGAPYSESRWEARARLAPDEEPKGE